MTPDTRTARRACTTHLAAMFAARVAAALILAAALLIVIPWLISNALPAAIALAAILWAVAIFWKGPRR